MLPGALLARSILPRGSGINVVAGAETRTTWEAAERVRGKTVGFSEHFSWGSDAGQSSRGGSFRER
jgi:hypothetical protein